MNANKITLVAGSIFGALIMGGLYFGVVNKFGWNFSNKAFLMWAVFGAGTSLSLGMNELSAKQRGVLSFLGNFLKNEGEPGIYWELPGVIGIQKILAPIDTLKISIKGPKIKGNVTLISAEGSIVFKVKDVAKAASVGDLEKIAKAQCEAAMRVFLFTQNVNQVENGRVDLLDALDLISKPGSTSSIAHDLYKEAAQVGLEIISIYLEAAEVPAALVAAQNQAAIEDAERIAQGKERIQRQNIIDACIAQNASFAEAQAEADRITGKATTLTTTQLTGGGNGKGKKKGAITPVVVVNANTHGGGSP